MLTILTMAGVCSFWQFYTPDQVPTVTPTRIMPEILVYQNTSRHIDFETSSEEERWESLQTTLKYLKVVSPESEAWLRYQHDNGYLQYSSGYTGYIAAFSPMHRTVILNESLFRMRDGEKASVIAHEYRHSLQCPSKFILAGLYMLVFGDLPTEYYEDEAEVFQQKVWFALLGINV